MKKHVWMSGAIALAMAGCQSAQKKEVVAEAKTEDQLLDEGVIQSYERAAEISTWMSYYEEDLKTGKIKVSELRNADRKIASVGPFMQLWETIGRNPELFKSPGFMNDALKEVNAAGRAVSGSSWKPLTKLTQKEIADLEQQISKNPKLDVALTERFHNNLLSQNRYKALVDSAAIKSNKDSLVAFKANLSKSVKQSKDGLLTVAGKTADSPKGTDDVLRQVHKTETTLVGGKYVNKNREQVLNSFVDRDIKRVRDEAAKSNRPAAEVEGIVENLNAIRKTEQEFMAVTGELPNYDGLTGKCIATDVETAKNYRQFSELKLKDAQDAVQKNKRAKKSRVFCERMRARGTVKFQASMGRTGTSRNLAGMEMSRPCHLTHTDELPVFQALNEGKLKDTDLESCPQ